MSLCATKPGLKAMEEMYFRPVLAMSDVISNGSSLVGEIFVDATWSTLTLTLILAYLALRTLLWQWRIGCYRNRYVLVTGCDTGFGFELVQRLDRLGFPVFAGCLTSDGLERVTKATSRRVLPLSLDVTDSQNIREVVQYMTWKMGPHLGLWGVVNNAGILPAMAPLELTSRDCFERTLAVNLMGTVEVTRACLPLLRLSGGRVINVSSVCGRLGFTAMDYTVSKFAVEGFTDCLRREVYRDGISVSTIAPGGFQTKLFDFDRIFAYAQQVFNTLDAEVQQHYGKDYVTSRKRVFDTVLRHFGWGNSCLNGILDVYEHALSARFPRTRYVVGSDARFFFQPLWHLPDFASDFLLTTWPMCKLLK